MGNIWLTQPHAFLFSSMSENHEETPFAALTAASVLGYVCLYASYSLQIHSKSVRVDWKYTFLSLATDFTSDKAILTDTNALI